MAAPGTGTARSGPTPLQCLAKPAGFFVHGDAACVSDADTLELPRFSLYARLDQNVPGRTLPKQQGLNALDT